MLCHVMTVSINYMLLVCHILFFLSNKRKDSLDKWRTSWLWFRIESHWVNVNATWTETHFSLFLNFEKKDIWVKSTFQSSSITRPTTSISILKYVHESLSNCQSMWVMLTQSIPISYRTEAFVKTEVGCTVCIYKLKVPENWGNAIAKVIKECTQIGSSDVQ